MKRSLIVFAFAATALAACDAQDATSPLAAPASINAAASATVQLGQEFQLKVGRSATVAGEGLTISFEGVPEDSRCPVGVQCIWAGNAVVNLVASKDGKAAGIQLNTTLEPHSATYLDYTITLVSLAPEATQAGVPQNKYVATLLVTKP